MKNILLSLILTLLPLFLVTAQQAGDMDLKFNPQDLGFGMGEGFNGPVNCVVEQPDGKLLVGGRFTAFNGVKRVALCRLNPNGTLDASFNNGPGFVEQFTNDWSLNVSVIRIMPDGKILIAGRFGRFNNVVRLNVCRLNPNGTLDQTFAGNVPGSIVTMDVQSTGAVIVGGLISPYPTSNSTGIIRLTPLGEIDGSFVGFSGFTFGPNTGGSLTKVLVDAQDRIWCGGFFSGFQGKEIAFLARLGSNGQLDTTINYGLYEAGFGNIQPVESGNLLVSGSFSFPFPTMFRIRTDGKIDSSFRVGPSFSTDSGGNNLANPLILPGFRNHYLCLAKVPYFNLKKAPGYVFLRQDGSRDSSRIAFPGIDLLKSNLFFTPIQNKRTLAYGEWVDTLGKSYRSILIADSNFQVIQDIRTSFPFGASGDMVTKAFRLLHSDILLRGSFSHYNKRKLSKGFVKISEWGEEDTLFSFKGIDEVQLVQRLSGKRLIVAGTRGTNTCLHIYDSLYRQISPDSNGMLISGQVFSIREAPNGKIYIGGTFSQINGQIRNSLARLLPNGSFDGGFVPSFSIAFGAILDFDFYQDGRVLVGGSFPNGLVRIDSGGTRDLGYQVNSTSVEKLKILPGKRVVIMSPWGLRTLDSLGTLETQRPGFIDNLTPGILSAFAYDFYYQDDGKIIVSGDFISVNSQQPISRIYRVLPNGQLDSSFYLGSGFGGAVRNIRVNSLVPLENGRLIAAGDFTSYKGIGRNRVAKIYYQRADILTDSVLGKQFCKAGTQKIAFRCQAFEPADSLLLQISNASGSFANPKVLATVKARQQDSVSFSFPPDLPAGNRYRFRWVATGATAKICYPSDTFSVVEPLVPTVSLQSNTSRDTLCFNQNLKVKINGQNQGIIPQIRWWVNGDSLSSQLDSLSLVAQFEDSLVLRLKIRSSLSCVNPAENELVKKFVVISPQVSLGPDTVLCPNSGFYNLPLVQNGTVLNWTATSGFSQTGLSTQNAGQFRGKLTISKMGCLASDSVNITVTNKPTQNITYNNGIIRASVLYGSFAPFGPISYQWLDCNLGFAPIIGETDSSFAPSVTGSYAVRVTKGACADTSVCLLVTSVAQPLAKTSDLEIFPNPNSGKATIRWKSGKAGERILLTTIEGKLVKTLTLNANFQATISGLSVGVYLVKPEKGGTRPARVMVE